MSSQSQSISELKKRQEEQMELLRAQHAEQLRLQREEQERALESLRRSQEQILSQQLSEFREQLRSAQATPKAAETVGDLRRTDLGLSAAPVRQTQAAGVGLPKKSQKLEVSESRHLESEKLRPNAPILAGKAAGSSKAPEPTEVGVNRRARQLLVRQGGKITSRLSLVGASAVVSADRTRVMVRSGTQEVSLSVDPATASAMRAQLAECGCSVRTE